MTRIPPPVMALVAAILMWVLNRRLPLVECVLPPWNRLAVLPGVIGIALDGAAFRRFRHHRTTVNPLDPGKASHLVTDGIFRFSRNPMYLGQTFILTGWAIWLGSAGEWLVLPLFIYLVTVLQILPEERALAKIFGPAYLDYKKSVGRWWVM